MLIKCPQCQTVYRLESEKLRDGISTWRKVG